MSKTTKTEEYFDRRTEEHILSLYLKKICTYVLMSKITKTEEYLTKKQKNIY